MDSLLRPFEGPTEALLLEIPMDDLLPPFDVIRGAIDCRLVILLFGGMFSAEDSLRGLVITPKDLRETPFSPRTFDRISDLGPTVCLRIKKYRS